jgi:hypothetical protein
MEGAERVRMIQLARDGNVTLKRRKSTRKDEPELARDQGTVER